jgi:hypothetical protein
MPIARRFLSGCSMKIAARVCFALLAAALLLPAQDQRALSPDESLILTLDKAWNVAEASKDVHALDQLLSSTLVYTDYDGSFMNKAQFLASVKSATLDADYRSSAYLSCAADPRHSSHSSTFAPLLQFLIPGAPLAGGQYEPAYGDFQMAAGS